MGVEVAWHGNVGVLVVKWLIILEKRSEKVGISLGSEVFRCANTAYSTLSFCSNEIPGLVMTNIAIENGDL